MKKTISLLMMSFMGLVGTYAWAGSAHEDTVVRMQKSVDVLSSIMSTPDKGIPEEVLSSAKCILVVPSLIKGGFIFGGKHGRGVASCRTSDGWSAPAFVSIGGGSWGLQIGVEGVDLVMLVMNDQGFQHLLSSKFELTGEGFRCGRPGGPSCFRRNGLEDEHGSADLLAFEGCIRRVDARRCSGGARQRLYTRHLRQARGISNHPFRQSADPEKCGSILEGRVRGRPTGAHRRS